MIHATRGDTAKAVTLDRVVLDPGATVDYHVKQRPGDVTASGAATIQDAGAGVVTFPVPDQAGRFDVEFKITYGDSSEESVPSVQADVLLVREVVG